MSRIDEALRRLKGGSGIPEPRLPSLLDRFTSEGKAPRIEESKSRDEHKVASFIPPSAAAAAEPRLPAMAKIAPVAAPQPQAEPKIVDPGPDANGQGDDEKLVDVRQLADYAG